MQSFDFSYKGSIHQFADQWYDAANNNVNTTKRMELYEKTEKLITFLQNNELNGKERIKELFEAFHENRPNDKLIEWISCSTSFEVKSKTEVFSGAFNVFTDLAIAIGKIERPSETLIKIGCESYDKITKQNGCLDIVDDEVFQEIFSKLVLKDKIALRETCKNGPIHFAKHEMKGYQLKKQTISRLYLNTQNLMRYLNLLGDEANKLLELDLRYLDLEGVRFVLSKCLNGTKIICDRPEIIDLITDNPKIAKLECHFKIDPRSFPKELISKLTGAYLFPNNESDLDQMFEVLKEVLPKFTMLRISSSKIVKLPDAFYTQMPALRYVDFSWCTALKEVGDMNNLLRCNFNHCTALEKVGNMSELKRADFYLCSGLKEVGNMTNLLKCDFRDCTALEKVYDMPNLQQGHFSGCILLKEVGKIPEHLNPLII